METEATFMQMPSNTRGINSMTSKEADNLYYIAQASIVGMYYYGHIKRDVAYSDFRAIEQEKSSIPLIEETIERKFSEMFFEIDTQRIEIEGF